MHSGGIIKILCSSNFELLVVAAFYNLGHHKLWIQTSLFRQKRTPWLISQLIQIIWIFCNYFWRVYFGRGYISEMSGSLSSDQHILETIFNPEHPIVGKL